ncbi:hypothetical protein ACWCQM_12855 [Streptomyces sp. NPDC002125]
MTHRSRRRRLSAVALLPLLGLAVACSEGTASPEASEASEASEVPGASGTPGAPEREQASAKPKARSTPLTATALTSAVLTEAEAKAEGFTVTGGDARDGAATRDLGKETSEPSQCVGLRQARSENAPDRGESAMAYSVMYRGEDTSWPRKTVLTSFPTTTARARMTELRGAVGACGRFEVKSSFGPSSVTVETLPAPSLGEEAVRYRMLSRMEVDAGAPVHYAYSLVTVVRVGGVMASVETGELLGPIASGQLEGVRPEPGPDERMIAALIEKVSEAERA